MCVWDVDHLQSSFSFLIHEKMLFEIKATNSFSLYMLPIFLLTLKVPILNIFKIFNVIFDWLNILEIFDFCRVTANLLLIFIGSER